MVTAKEVGRAPFPGDLPALHHASRKLATLRDWQVSLCATLISRRSVSVEPPDCPPRAWRCCNGATWPATYPATNGIFNRIALPATVEHAICGRVSLVVLPRVPHHARAGRPAGRAVALCCACLSASPCKATTPPLARLRGLRPCRRRRAYGATTHISPPSRSEGGLQPAPRASAVAFGSASMRVVAPHMRRRREPRVVPALDRPRLGAALFSSVGALPDTRSRSCPVGALTRKFDVRLPPARHGLALLGASGRGNLRFPACGGTPPLRHEVMVRTSDSHRARKPRVHNLAIAQKGHIELRDMAGVPRPKMATVRCLLLLCSVHPRRFCVVECFL